MTEAISTIFLEDDADTVPEDLPPAKVLAQVFRFSDSEMLAFMDKHRMWGDPFPQFVEWQRSYLTRMTNMDRGEMDPGRWEREMERLVNDKVRAVRGISRRVHQQTMTLAACDGNPQQLLAWVDENDDNTCDDCEQLALEPPMTYAQRASTYGQLPGQRCQGGADCRCDLMAVGRR